MSKRASCRESIIGQSPFEFNELVVHILCLTCTSQINGLTNAVNVSQLRGVNSTFRNEIDTSLLLWRFMLGFTYRAKMEPPSVNIPSKTINEMKEFIILDSEEYWLRYRFVRAMGDYIEVTMSYKTGDPRTFDYTEVSMGPRVFRSFGHLHDHIDDDVEEYKEIVANLNRLCHC